MRAFKTDGLASTRYWGSLGLSKPAIVLAVFFVVGATLPNLTHAQLRTVAGERHVKPKASSSEPATKRTASDRHTVQSSVMPKKPEIASVSHADSGSPIRIKENEVEHGKTSPVIHATRTPKSGSAGVSESSHVTTASCNCGSNTSMSVNENYFDVTNNYAYESGLGHEPSCGCDSCDSFGEIAPTCHQYRCGGLLQSIWCRLAVRAEVPIYWRSSASPPALVSTGNGNNLGNILLGDQPLNEDSTTGFRLTLSTWLGRDDYYGLMFRYWNAGSQDDSFLFDSGAFPTLARPFINTTTGTPALDTLQVALPGTSTGSITVDSSSEASGLEVTLKRLLYKDRFTRLDWLYGYQHVSIDEGLIITSNSTGLAAPFVGVNSIVRDSFATENSFHGVSYGLMSSRNVGFLKLETMFRLGVGNLRRTVQISGATNIDGIVSNQGLLARATNSRTFEDDTYIVLPEVGFNVAYSLTQNIDFNVGYNFLHVPKVARANDQINDSLRSNLSNPLTGSPDPVFNFVDQSFGLHSLGFGMQLRY